VVERLARRLALEYNTGLNRGYIIAMGDNKKSEVTDNGWQNYLGDAKLLLQYKPTPSLLGHLE